MAIGNLAVGNFRNLSATANIKAGQGALLGVLCSTSTGGTLILYDDAATGTTTPITGTIALVAGQFYTLPVAFANGLYAVVGGTASITVAYV